MMAFLPRFLFEPWMVRWAASVSPGVGHLLAKRFAWGILFWAIGSVVDFLAVLSYRAEAFTAMSLYALGHFVLIGVSMVHVERYIPARATTRPSAAGAASA